MLIMSIKKMQWGMSSIRIQNQKEKVALIKKALKVKLKTWKSSIKNCGT